MTSYYVVMGRIITERQRGFLFPFVSGVNSWSPTHIIGPRCVNDFFVFFLVQYVQFVSGAANVYDVTAVIGTMRRIGARVRYRTEVIIQVYVAHLLDVSQRLKVFPSSSAPGSEFRLRTTFVGFALQEQCLKIFLRNFRLIF